MLEMMMMMTMEWLPYLSLDTMGVFKTTFMQKKSHANAHLLNPGSSPSPWLLLLPLCPAPA
jgi:hypothetical protein